MGNLLLNSLAVRQQPTSIKKLASKMLTICTLSIPAFPRREYDTILYNQ